MFDALPTSPQEFMQWGWPRYEPFFDELKAAALDGGNVEAWLAAWTRLYDMLQETYARLYVDTTLHTDDREIEQRFNTFLEQVYQPWQAAEQALKEKLLHSGLEPQGFDVPLRQLRAEARIFAEANLPLKVEERKLGSEYNRIIGAQTIEWQGEELTITQLAPLSDNPDRAVREEIWRRASARVLADREAINDVWRRLLDVRAQMTRNAGLPEYRAYAWHERLRFDYTPDDCITFQDAIEEVIVPAAARVYERRRARLGVETLRPWDINVDPMRTTDLAVDPYGDEPVRPFADTVELQERASVVFHRVDPQLGAYFDTLRGEGLLDLDNYRGKGPGAYCMTYPASRRPFVFMNAVGTPANVDTLLHECGHAFHAFERFALPYAQQRVSPMEFNEVASMAMELLAAPYLLRNEGGFYTLEAAARSRINHLEEMLIFWPYMAVVDAFQHWVYTHHDEARDPAACDAVWGELWRRFIVGVDWSRLEQEQVTGWQRKLHIFRYPFYYVEYGLAQLGAAQVWRNALNDQAEAVRQYRAALALGGTAPLPHLFATAGARFGFDAGLLREVVAPIETTIERLQAV